MMKVFNIIKNYILGGIDNMLKDLVARYWKKGFYTMAKMRSWTQEIPTDKRYSYDEFYEHTGVTVEDYDANVDIYKDMNYPEVTAYLAEQKMNA